MNTVSNYTYYTLLGKVPEIEKKLDPISVLAVTALFQFKAKDTRLKIEGYHLQTDQPQDNLISQWVMRRIKRLTTKDLKIVKVAVNRATSWFAPFGADNSHIKTLLMHSKLGLKALQQTYKENEDIVEDGIQLWLGKIDQSFELEDVVQEKLTESEMQLKKLWKEAEIRDLNSLLDQLLEAKNDNTKKEKIELFEKMIEQKSKRLQAIHEPLK